VGKIDFKTNWSGWKPEILMKKILKYVLGIVWLLLTVFLLAGLLFPQVKYDAQTSVNLPLSETFTLFNDIEKTKEWIPEIQSITPVKETPDIIGSQHKMVIQNEGTAMEMLETVTDYQVNKKVVLEFDADMMSKTDQYTFAEKDGNTTISHQSAIKAKGYINRCFFAFLKGSFKKIDQGSLDNFKKYAEGL